MMKKLTNLLFVIICFMAGSQLYAQGTVSGNIVDDTGEPLIGANVIIDGTTIGTTTDFDGNFSLNTDMSFPLVLDVSYIGYTAQKITVDSPTSNLGVTLSEGLIFGEDVVISASRRKEKVQEAPASISVLTARKLEGTPNPTDVTRNLVSTPGVQIQQQSANRINISMRGGAGLFGTSVFPILDYRSLVGPGIGTFQSDQAGLSGIDLQRIEVVRGPGSALYGPGVTQGVVHFISKNPIDFPGTTVELFGGQLNTLGAGIRHATKISDKIGFKINAQHRRGNEFTLNPEDSLDQIQIAKFQRRIVQPAVRDSIVDAFGSPKVLLTEEDLDPDGDGNMMAEDWFNTSINATLELRPTDNLGVTVAGGFNQARSVFYNEQGEGLSQAKEYWTQARVQAGGLFAQAFYVINDGGTEESPTFLYQTGNRTPVGRTQLEAQVQYNFDTPSLLNANWTVGTDYRFAGQDTENLVYGRNEFDDDFSIIGAYVQGKFGLTSKLDMVVAGRYDQFNFIDEGAFAPRLAFVYKAAPNHTFRASYNRSSSTVSNLQLNIDFPLAAVSPGVADVWLYGNKTPQTFNNAQTAWLLPGVPTGLDQLPLGLAYASVNEPTVAGLLAAIAGTALEPLGPAMEAILNGVNPSTLGVTGTLSPGFNIFDGTPLGLQDAPISQIATDDNFEIGYKGLIGDKLGVTLDVYRVTQKGNSQFTAISPAYRISTDAIGSDLGSAIWTQTADQFTAVLAGAGFPQDQIDAILPQIEGAVLGAYAAGGAGFAAALDALPFHAFTPTDQVPDDGINHLAAGYRTFDERTFHGWDLGLEYYVNENLSLFGNYSGVDKVQFEQTVRGGDGTPLPTYLNIPKNKFRFGFNYTPLSGFRGNLSFQHDDSYFASAGQYTGDTEERNLIDAGVGYKFGNGLTIDLTSTNLLGTQYRYLPNMPKIGRRALAKVTYTFGAE